MLEQPGRDGAGYSLGSQGQLAVVGTNPPVTTTAKDGVGHGSGWGVQPGAESHLRRERGKRVHTVGCGVGVEPDTGPSQLVPTSGPAPRRWAHSSSNTLFPQGRTAEMPDGVTGHQRASASKDMSDTPQPRPAQSCCAGNPA